MPHTRDMVTGMLMTTIMGTTTPTMITIMIRATAAPDTITAMAIIITTPPTRSG